MTELKLREQIQLNADILIDPLWQGNRITLMLNQAQNWMQQQLLKQGSLNWKTEVALSFSIAVLQGVNCTKADVPSNWLKDMPLEQIYPVDVPTVGTTPTRPCREVDIRNLVEITENAYTIPTAQRSIFVLMDTDIYVFPATVTDGDLIYTRKVLDLVFNNNSTNSEIPAGMLGALVDRVVTQINVIKGGAQLTQLMIDDIDKRIAQKYQLDGAKEERVDREVTQ